MLFWNRLTREVVKELPNQIILGQWQVITEVEKVFMNTIELTNNSREYIFPDSVYCCSLCSANSTLPCEKQFPKWQLPSNILSESLRSFELERQKLLSNSTSWINWVKLPPLVPKIEDKINIQALEVTTKQNLGHLEEICCRPRTYLKMETERLPVSRAQRISHHAAEFLASHTEDWERRTFRSVVPKRVLCIVKEELLDIYENKVTVRLIDNLLEYTRQRIQQVETLKRQLEEAEYLSGTTSDIHWRNRQRIYQLWGNDFDAATPLKRAEVTLRHLLQLQYKLQSLIGTDFYKAIPQRVVIGSTLKRTNILVNDQHYRYVDLLWREWSRCHHGQAKNSRQVFEENQKLFRGFESFCLLLIGRALTGSGNDNDKGFGFKAIANLIPTRGGETILFRGALGEVSLTWQEDGSFLLHSDGIKDLHLVPIIATLTASNNSETIASILETFSRSLRSNTESLNVILYPGTEEERKKLPFHIQRRINTLGNDRLPQEAAMAILPVSPLDIISVERIARAVQWWLNSQRYQSYPRTLPINIPDTLLKDIDWLEKENKSNLVRVLRSPLPEDEHFFKTKIQNFINQLQSSGSKERGQLQQIEKIKNIPSQAKRYIQLLQICPVCYSTGSFTALNSQCFHCKCSKCESSWGTRSCGSCGEKYPYIHITGVVKNNRQPDWVERTLGREIIAVSCWKNNNYSNFICPHCGTCSQAELNSVEACIRCQTPC
jgi:hypothetical protein